MSRPSLEELLRAALVGPEGPVARAAVAGAAAALRSVPGSATSSSATWAAADALAGLLIDPDPPARAAPGPAALGPHTPPSVEGPAPGTLEKVEPGGTGSNGTGPSAPTGVTKPEPILIEFAQRFAADPDVTRFVGGTSPRADPATARASDPGPSSAAHTWTWLWLTFLRLPEDLAERWRGRARELLTSAGPPNDAPVWHELPGDGEVLVEPAPLFGAAGLRTSPEAAPHPDVATLLPTTSPYRAIRVVAGQVRELIELDHDLHHALESRRKTGLHPLRESDNLDDLRLDLAYRLGDMAAAAPGSLHALEELRRLDEVLCSVVHVPPAHPDSWWGRLAQRSRRILSDAAIQVRADGTDVQIRVPQQLVDYATQRELLGRYNVGCTVTGAPDSEVLACLRVWMRSGGETHPARIVYVRNAE